MAVRIAHTIKTDPQQAVDELSRPLGEITPTFIIYFLGINFNHMIIANLLKKRFPEAALCGCSTAGDEIISGKMLKKSCVAMAFDAETIAECSVQPLYNIATEDHIPFIFRNFERTHDISFKTVNPKEWTGIILIDGLQKAEERIMERLGKAGPISFIGGAAGDDLQFKTTWIHCDGRAYSGGAALALIKPAKGFDIIKTQSFSLRHKTLTATRVDESKRTVFEFNHKPATIAYAEALGMPEDEVTEKFMSNPVGLIIDGEPFVRSPQQVIGQAIVFYCAVKQGMELQLLEATDIIEGTRKALARKISTGTGTPALINFNCILRAIELDQNNQLEAYGQLFTAIPTIGFSTYGEEYITHINQTATMLLLH